MPDPTLMDIVFSLSGDLAKIAAGGVVASTITLFVSGRRQDRELHRAAKSLAIQLIDYFERFTLACAKVPGENADGGRERRDPYDFSGLSRLPDFLDLPKDEAGWRALDADLAIDCRTFPTKVGQSRDTVGWAGDQGDADDTEVTMNKEAMILGLEAWRLADKMRERFSFGKAAAGWDVEGDLSRRLADLKAKEAAYWVSNAQMVAEISEIARPETAGVAAETTDTPSGS